MYPHPGTAAHLLSTQPLQTSILAVPKQPRLPMSCKTKPVLPNEIWYEILDLLPETDRRNLSMTCRLFADYVQPRFRLQYPRHIEPTVGDARKEIVKCAHLYPKGQVRIWWGFATFVYQDTGVRQDVSEDGTSGYCIKTEDDGKVKIEKQKLWWA